MKKLVVILGGGMGNQLFQYATARALQIEYQAEVKLSTYMYDNNKCSGRSLSLEPFAFFDHQMLCSKSESDKAYEKYISGVHHNCEKCTNRFLPFLLDVYRRKLARKGVIRQTRGGVYRYDKIALYSDDNVMYGGFQSPKFFDRYGGQIRKDLQIKIPPRPEKNGELLEQISSNESVCVHVRRGDFLDKEFRHLNICTKAYYENSIEYMREHLKNPVFYIFSNTSEDIEWIKENWKLQGKVVYVDNDNQDYEDLQLMSMCKHFIIANSTFSWWAQFLSDNDDKIVCAPPEWDKKYLKTSKDIYEDCWTIMR